MIEKKISLRLLDEHVLRIMLNHFHASIVGSTANARYLLDKDPNEIDPSKAEGSDIAKNGLRAFVVWMKILEDFSKSPEIFRSQILEPFRIVCRYLVDTREMYKTTTTSVDGFVLGKSKPVFDRNSGENRVALMMVIPEIGSVMSLRTGEMEASDMSRGYYKFDNLVPIPLVDRIHQYRPRMTKIGALSNMVQHDFLKASFGDLKHLSESVEMEDFFEMISSDSGAKLFSIVIIAARIISVNMPFVTLQDLIGVGSMTMRISGNYQSSSERNFFRGMENQNARIMAAIPFRDGTEETKQNAEILYTEPGVELDELEVDDLVGYVRRRNTADIAEINSRYPRANLKNIPVLSVSGSTVRYSKVAQSQDLVKSEYLKAVEKIRLLRKSARSANNLHVTAADILDYDKMTVGGVVQLLKKIPFLSNLLRLIFFRADLTGEIETFQNLSVHTRVDLEKIKKACLYLERIQLLKIDDYLVRGTHLGHQVLYQIYLKEIEEYVSSRSANVISIPDFHHDVIPQSLLYEFLSNNRRTYQPLALEGGITELFWMKRIGNVSGNKTFAEIDFARFSSRLLFEIRTTNHPFTAAYLVGELNKKNKSITNFVASIALNELAKMGKIVSSGDSWEYPTKYRILDFLKEDQQRCHSVGEMMEKIGLPLLERGNVESMLKEMALGGIATEILPNLWCISSDAQKNFSRYVLQKIKPWILTMLQTKGHIVAESRVVTLAVKQAEEMLGTVQVFTLEDVVKESLVELVLEGKIVLNDGYYEIKKI